MKYRWLEVGKEYIYSPASGKARDDLKGQTCKVLNVPKAGTRPGNVRVLFPNNEIHIVPSGVLRKKV
jgi:hypothetical protein